MLFLSAKFFMPLWARNLADALEKSEGDMMREMLCQVVKCVEKKITKIPSILLAEFRKTTYFCTQVLNLKVYCTTRSRTWSVIGLLWAETKG